MSFMCFFWSVHLCSYMMDTMDMGEKGYRDYAILAYAVGQTKMLIVS